MITADKPTTKGQTSDLAKIEETKIELPLLQPFILETPDGDISEVGQEGIEWLLRCAQLPPLPKEWEWKWATNRGTLPKRIQAYYFKTHQLKIGADVVSEIGNTGKAHASVAGKVILDFTEKLNWSDGDFGDGGSCFWGDKSGARDMIEKEAYAVRAYKVRDGYTVESALKDARGRKGYARAWVAEIGDNRLVVFNGYGEGTLTFARWLALLFNCTYKRISLTNQGVDDGVLWINGAVGFAVGTQAKIGQMIKHDFGWTEIHDERYVCEMCDTRLAEDEALTAWDRRGGRLTSCDECCNHCHDCGENYTYELREIDGDGEYRCNACREEVLKRYIREAKNNVARCEEKVEEIQGKIDDLEEELNEAKEHRDEEQENLERLEGEVD